MEFVINNVREQMTFLPGGEPGYLKRKTGMGITPGQDFGIPLVVIGFGADVILIDRYICDWEANFHPVLYRELWRRVKKRYRAFDLRPLDQVIRNAEQEADGLTLYRFGLEDAGGLPSGSVHISVSNACFEHLVDARAALLELGRITKERRVGFHEVDFQTTATSIAPLSTSRLLMTPFARCLFIPRARMGVGSVTPIFHESLKEAGFVVDFRPNMFADDRYLDDVTLGATLRYRAMPRGVLRVFSGWFHIKKRSKDFH